ncbi:MAG: hypothetical protein IKG89_01860 [Oscillospiraceae bacterium]|nr:hypothetical protein [Oscillospiraceae bacterium]
MNWSIRYLRRLLGRNPGRSLLSLGLAALLALAFGLVTVLRGMYAELYQNVEVRPVFTGIPYARAMKAEKSGYLRDPFYEYTAQGVMVELNDQEYAVVLFTNRLDRSVREKVQWAEGWDEESFFQAQRAVCVMNARYAESLGKRLGDRVRVNEADWLANVSPGGESPFRPGETVTELRDRKRPFLTVVGLVYGELEDHILFYPAGANQFLKCFYAGDFNLEIAEYTLNDYLQAAEFRNYARGLLDGVKGDAVFTMDTGNADRIYEMHRLLETLYPLTIAAALLLGGVLPGLMVLHASREISILRALGVKVRSCVGVYTAAQVLCAGLGLLLGLALVFVIRRPEWSAAARPFGLYLAAHLAASALGSGVFAWLSARRHVLELLQSKE